MKIVRLTVLACVLALAPATPLLAGEKAKGKSPKASGSAKPEQPWIDVKVDISVAEREIISSYVRSCQEATARGHKHRRLPPGLAKKVARGGNLPPGWQKKCVRGEKMPVEVYEQCHPLPREVVVKLPTPPEGTILVTIDGKVMRLVKATLEILDVFDVL